MKLGDLRNSLAPLSERLNAYCQAIREGGFTTCLVNEDWIDEHCDTFDLEIHKRYLVEFAREVLISDKPENIIYNDALNCKSRWLNDLKARRFAEYGSINKLDDNWNLHHLKQLSPCFRELIRLSNSPNAGDKKIIASQVAEFARRREGELTSHHKEINQLIRRFPAQLDEETLQTFFAQLLSQLFQEWGGEQRQTMRPKGRISIVTFDVSGGAVLALNPNMTVRSPKESIKHPSGRLSVAFRLMEKDAVDSPMFLRERQLVLRLANLLPNEFNDYGIFEGQEEFCINVLAWEAALRILLPDVLRTLRAPLE